VEAWQDPAPTRRSAIRVASPKAAANVLSTDPAGGLGRRKSSRRRSGLQRFERCSRYVDAVLRMLYNAVWIPDLFTGALNAVYLLS
jgi:hypothetical protein